MANESTSVPPRSNFGMRGIETPDVDAMGRKSNWRKGKPSSADAGEAKRNAAMAVVAIGAGAFGIWAFVSSGNGKDAHGKVYASVAECATDGAVGKDNCSRLWREALRLHTNHAPLYETLAKCEEVHGPRKCEQPADAANVERRAMYIPRMSGYAMGRLALGGYQGAPLYKLKSDKPLQYRMAAAPEPVKDSSGRVVGAFVWINRAKASTEKKPVGKPLFGKPTRLTRGEAPAKTAQRGGFGGASKGRSGGG